MGTKGRLDLGQTARKFSEKSFFLLHLARTPFTGVWSVLRSLALYQIQIGLSVAVGVLVHSRWTKQYGQALRDLERAGIETFTNLVPDLPYTALYPYLVARWWLTGHPWEQWIADFARERHLAKCVVHCHNAWLSGAYLPYRVGRDIDVRFVATYHGIQGAPVLQRSWWRRVIHRWLAQRFVRYGGKLASVDAENTHVAESLFGIPANAFRVIPNGVSEIVASKPSPFPTDIPSIGHVGTLDEGKGWRITAEAVRLANERGIICRFVVAGSGPETQIAQNWCEKHAAFTTFLGWVERAGETVTPHLTLFALPSRAEGSPMAAIEALAAGVPVLGTEVSGLSQIIEHGRSGLVVARNAESLADAICNVLGNPKRLEILRRGAREVFAERFHIAHCAAAYDDLYHSAFESG